ncbi:MAG: cell division protein FtsZ [Saprospiraceae bacterium]|jgi:cell division protein FtsZ
MMQFDLPKDENSIIKVFGVGGGGSNAVNHMYRQGITGVEFYVCNTDQQALDISPIPNKVQLGMTLTAGRGAGSVSEVGKNAALENLDEIKEILGNDTKMVFITAGMGGGTGTGAAPIIAQAAKEMGILTVGIVTYPFAFEGKKRSMQADEGMDELRENVDTLLIICNDKLREIYGNLSLKNAFAKADDILTIAAKGIAEVITVTGYINVDFEDVRTVMTNSGVAIMGSAAVEGENRAIIAVQEALASPLLNDNNIEGANYILLNITSGEEEVLMDEITEITDYIQDEAGLTADIIWGSGTDENLGEKICVTLIATGFSNSKEIGGYEGENKEEDKVVHKLTNEYKEPDAGQGTAETEKKNELESKPAEELPLTWGVKQEETPEEDGVVRYNLYDPEPEVTVQQKEELPSFAAPSITTDDTPGEQAIEETSVVSITEEINEVEENTISEAPSFAFSQDIEEVPEQEEPGFSYSREPSSPSGSNLGEGMTPTPPVRNSKSTFAQELDEEENLRRSQERIAQLKNMSMKMQSPSGIADLENQPAYVRRNVKLNEVESSAENTNSRYSVGKDDEDNTELRSNNSFLHDNVD